MKKINSLGLLALVASMSLTTAGFSDWWYSQNKNAPSTSNTSADADDTSTQSPTRADDAMQQQNRDAMQQQMQNRMDRFSQSGEDTSDRRQAARNFISDQELAKRIQDRIGSGWLSRSYDRVRVLISNGNVTLMGSVPTPEDRERLDKMLRNLDGVKNLNLQLTVQDNFSPNKQKNDFPQDRSANASDEQLNKRIRDRVSRGWFWNNFKDLTLNTSNGVVTLEGSVDSPKDQEQLTNDIQKMDGVRSVRSNLSFKNRSAS